MNKYFCIVLLSIVFSFNLRAQTKLLTIEDASYMSPKLNAANLSQLQWLPGAEQFVYVANNSLIQGSAAKPKRDTLVRLPDLNLLLKYNKLDTLKRFPSVTFLTKDQFYYISGSKLFQCDIMKLSLIHI